MAESSVVSVAILSASYNIILQILVRILSSLSNAVIFRLIAKEALGVINVRLLLLYSTCHCFSREAFRRSCLSKFDSKSLQKKFNILWMVFPVCALCSLLLRYIWLYLLVIPEPSQVSNYTSGVNAIILSVFIECLAEPLYVFSQSSHFVKLKVVTEGLMLTVRSISMVVFLSLRPHQVMYGFCFSQLLSSLVYTFTFYMYFIYYLNSKEQKENPLLITSISNILPSIQNYVVNKNDIYLTWSFFKQTLLKQLLTEGERYLMTFFSLLSFAEQGLYDVVNNLGSLAARLIFLPIEDSAYILFTQLLSRYKTSEHQENTSMCLAVLEKVLKLMVLLGLTILIFGFSYSQLLLQLYGGLKLSSGIGLVLMRWHCLYVLLLAINGITEGFKFAVMSHQQIDKYNKNLVLLSVGFLATAYCFVVLFGSSGFILANCLNMSFRIVHSTQFILEYFRIPKYWLKKCIPHPLILMTLFLVLCSTSVAEAFLCCGHGIHLWIWHLLLGFFCFLVFLCAVWVKERPLIRFVHEQWREKDPIKSKTS